MRIEIHDPPTPAFCREVVCVLTQHRELLKRPEAKLRNVWAWMYGTICFCLAMLVFNTVSAIYWDTDFFLMVLVYLVHGVVLSFDLLLLGRDKELYRGLLERGGSAVLTVDAQGVELDRPGRQRVRLDWGTVAFVRVFRESLCVVPRETGGVLIAVSARHAAAVMEALKENDVKIEVY